MHIKLFIFGEQTAHQRRLCCPLALPRHTFCGKSLTFLQQQGNINTLYGIALTTLTFIFERTWPDYVYHAVEAIPRNSYIKQMDDLSDIFETAFTPPILNC